MAYVKYVWVGNRIMFDDMAAMYKMKVETRTPITKIVAAAVSEYVRKFNSLKVVDSGMEVVENGNSDFKQRDCNF